MSSASLRFVIVVLSATLFLTSACAPKWTQVVPAGGPPDGRWQHGTIYDAANKRMVIYAGKTKLTDYPDDLWVLDHATGKGGVPTWTKLAPVGPAPPGRHMPAVAYDPATNRMMMFGGHVGGEFVNDYWVLDNANGLGGPPVWKQLPPSTSVPLPIGREWHTVSYDGANNRLILFGGWRQTGGIANDVWVLSNANGNGGEPKWQQLAPAGPLPVARAGHTAVYDQKNNRLIVFGGGHGCCPPFFNDIWVLTNANGLGGAPVWIQLLPAGPVPDAREDHTAVYAAAKNVMIVFGGWRVPAAPNYLADVWELKNANGLGGAPAWVNVTPKKPPSPGGRELPSAVLDEADHRVVVFGGSYAAFDPNNIPICNKAGDGACTNDLWHLGPIP